MVNKIKNSKVVSKTKSFINIKYGLLGATFMGSWVYFLNMDYPWPKPFEASMKQAAYTFFVGGLLTKMVEIIVKKEKPRNMSIVLAVLASTIITAILMFLLHYIIKGTPAKMETVVWTILVAPPGFIIVAIRERLIWEKKTKFKFNKD